VFGAYTDVYSLAATLYHLLTNKIPIPANFRAQGVPLTPPKEYNSQISDRIDRAILNGMALEPRKRPQSIQEFKDLLKSDKIITPKPTYQHQILEGRDVPWNISTTVSKLAAQNLSYLSASTINYNQLESLLTSGQWKAANEETVKIMLTITKREIAGWLRVEDIEKFPCPELRIIDQFWTHYSNNHFGFTVQQQLHQNLGGTRKFNKDVWGAFVQQVGWKQENRWLRYEDFSFHLQAPKAHLPFPWVMGLENWAFAGVWITSLAWKIVKCNI
jgi:serine/threonine protein kinase